MDENPCRVSRKYPLLHCPAGPILGRVPISIMEVKRVNTYSSQHTERSLLTRGITHVPEKEMVSDSCPRDSLHVKDLAGAGKGCVVNQGGASRMRRDKRGIRGLGPRVLL